MVSVSFIQEGENRELNEILDRLRFPAHIIKQVNDLVGQYQGRKGKDNSYPVQFCPKCGRRQNTLSNDIQMDETFPQGRHKGTHVVE